MVAEEREAARKIALAQSEEVIDEMNQRCLAVSVSKVLTMAVFSWRATSRAREI